MNSTQDFQFTVLVPFFNEEDNVLRLFESLKKFIDASAYKTCVLFINDGSTDNGLTRIKEICRGHNNFFYISLEKNIGLSGALKAGFDLCYSEFVGYIDADLQTTPDDFELLLPHAKSHPLVMGIRADRKDSYFKNLQSKVANNFRRSMTGDKAIDTGCPLKVFQTKYAKKIPMFNGMHRFFPALIMLQPGGDAIKQIPVRHFPRIAGVSKYNLWNRLISPFKDCFAYRWMKHRYINYSVSENNINIEGKIAND